VISTCSYDDGKYLIKTPFVPTMITVATEELGKVCSNVQPIKSSCMVPPDTAPELVEVIRAMVLVVTGTSGGLLDGIWPSGISQ
jgi:hypothetical protein